MWRAAPVILLFVLVIVFFYPVIFGGKALLPAEYLAGMKPWNAAATNSHQQPQWNPLLWDGIAEFYPWRVHYSRTLSDGFIPLWNPHQFCGTPFAANAQTAVFYPLNLLFVLLAPVNAFGMSAALHLFLAALFTFMLARRLGIGRTGALVSAVTFAFSAFMVVWIELPTLIDVAAWLPLVLYLVLRSWERSDAAYAVLAGLSLGVSILAGHLQIASYVIGTAALWWLWLIVSRARNRGSRTIMKGVLLAALCFAVALLIAAPQLLPTLELAGMSHRVRGITAEGYARYAGNAIPARSLITLFVPNVYGNTSTNSYWAGSAADFMERALYIGILPLVLAIIGAVFAIRWKAVGFFVVLSVLALLFAFGSSINALPYYLLPGTGALGGPNRAIVLFCFAMAMLAGFGAHWFIDHAQDDCPRSKRKLGWRALANGSAIFAVILIGAQSIASAGISGMGVGPGKVASAALGQYISFGVMLIAALGILGLYTAGLIPRRLFTALALAAVVGDLFSFGMGFNPVASPENVYARTGLTDWLERNADTSRLMPINNRWSLYENPGALLPPNAATVYGLYDVQGYDSLFSKSYKDFVDGRLGADSSPQENGNMLFIKAFTPDWPPGTAHYVLSAESIASPDLTLVFEADGVRIYKKRGYQNPYLISRTGGAAEPSVGRNSYRAWITNQDANQIGVTVTNVQQPSRLVLANACYPGWRADVDGVDRPVSAAQGIFQSVEVEPGNHTVVFRFLPGSFIVGTFFGLLGVSVVGFVAGLIWARRGTR